MHYGVVGASQVYGQAFQDARTNCILKMNFYNVLGSDNQYSVITYPNR